MKKEDLLKLGLTEEQIKEVQRLNGLDIEPFKTKETDLTNQLKTATDTIAERDKQLSDIKKEAGDNESLKNKITELETSNKTAAEKYASDLKDLKLTNAIKLAINGKVHDEDMTASLFDKSKLLLGDDGKITGLDDQLKGLQESKAFLFKATEEKKEPTDPMAGFKFGAGDEGKQPTAEETLNNAFGLTN